MPRVGDKAPWISRMNYYLDKRDYHKYKDLNDPVVELHWNAEKKVAQSQQRA